MKIKKTATTRGNLMTVLWFAGEKEEVGIQVVGKKGG